MSVGKIVHRTNNEDGLPFTVRALLGAVIFGMLIVLIEGFQDGRLEWFSLLLLGGFTFLLEKKNEAGWLFTLFLAVLIGFNSVSHLMASHSGSSGVQFHLLRTVFCVLLLGLLVVPQTYRWFWTDDQVVTSDRHN